jgi:KUP system potassium uptake protein
VEAKVMYSIFRKQPKRAGTYWLLHINRVDEPYRFEYEVNHIIPETLIRIDFHIGFKVDPKINLFFREVVEDLIEAKEIKMESSYTSLKKYNFPGDCRFVLLDRIMIKDFQLTRRENFVLAIRNLVRYLSIPEERALQLDTSRTVVEKIPINIESPGARRIERSMTGASS